MKKMLIAIFALSLGITMMAAAPKKAAKAAAPAPAPADNWAASDLGFWFGVPGSMRTANVNGWRVGLPISYGEGCVAGVESGLFCAATDNIEGLQISFGVCMSKDLAGVQIAPVNYCGKEAKGSQIGIVNVIGKRGWQIGVVNASNNAKFQLGLVNINKDGLWPVMLIVNFGRDTFKSGETIRAEQAACQAKCAKASPKKK